MSRVNVGSIAVPNAESASWTTGTNAAARIATIPTTKLTPVADDARALPRVPRASASSSVVRASDRARPESATTRSATTGSGPCSIGPVASAARPTHVPANSRAFRESFQRSAPRAIDRFRQRNASAMSANATMRDSTARPSGSRAGRTRPHSTPAASVTMRIVVPRRSLFTSRWIVTSSRPMPNSPSVQGTIGGGRVPVVKTGAIAAMHVNATASTKQRAPMRIATAPLARTTQLSRVKDVEDDAAPAKVRGELGIDRRDAHSEHAVMRAPQCEHRAGETGRDLRRDHDQRRAPGQPTALSEEHRLRRIRGIRSEAREDLKAPRQRMRTAPERRARSFMREVVQTVRHQSDLAADVRSDAHHVRRGRHDELHRFGVRLDPVLLVRRDVDQEDRVEARRGLVQLGLKLAQAGRCLPVDLLARIAAAMLAHAAKAQRVGQESTPGRELRQRP